MEGVRARARCAGGGPTPGAAARAGAADRPRTAESSGRRGWSRGGALAGAVADATESPRALRAARALEGDDEDPGSGGGGGAGGASMDDAVARLGALRAEMLARARERERSRGAVVASSERGGGGGARGQYERLQALRRAAADGLAARDERAAAAAAGAPRRAALPGLTAALMGRLLAPPPLSTIAPRGAAPLLAAPAPASGRVGGGVGADAGVVVAAALAAAAAVGGAAPPDGFAELVPRARDAEPGGAPAAAATAAAAPGAAGGASAAAAAAAATGALPPLPSAAEYEAAAAAVRFPRGADRGAAAAAHRRAAAHLGASREWYRALHAGAGWDVRALGDVLAEAGAAGCDEDGAARARAAGAVAASDVWIAYCCGPSWPRGGGRGPAGGEDDLAAAARTLGVADPWATPGSEMGAPESTVAPAAPDMYWTVRVRARVRGGSWHARGRRAGLRVWPAGDVLERDDRADRGSRWRRRARG